MNIRILPPAIGDLDAGRRFYEMQEAGLGAYFLESLFADIDSLILYAGIHQQVFGFYRLLSKRFPYAVYYTLQQDAILIYRVLDMRRDPDKLLKDLPNFND